MNRLALKSLAANVGLKVIADTLVFGPVHVIAFFAFMEVVEGRGLAGAVRKVKDDFWSTFVVELAFWPAFQAINFWRVPVEHQLLAVNAACILDCTFLCWQVPGPQTPPNVHPTPAYPNPTSPF